MTDAPVGNGLHVPAVARLVGGERYLTYCVACSEKAGELVNPCTVLEVTSGQAERMGWPPPYLQPAATPAEQPVIVQLDKRF